VTTAIAYAHRVAPPCGKQAWSAWRRGIPQRHEAYAHKHKIKTLVLNGAECEPYITCDDLLMRERAGEILQGAEIMRALLYAEEVLIGIEDNKAGSDCGDAGG